MRTYLFIPLMALVTLAGCGQTMTELPVGRWQGQGRYIEYLAKGPITTTRPGELDRSAISEQSQNDTYPTTLAIRQENIFDHPAYVLEITSDRGKLLELGDKKTQLKLALRLQSELPDNTRLYQVVDLRYGQTVNDPWNQEQFVEPFHPVQAVLIPQPTGVLLHLYYLVPNKDDSICFQDTFQFEKDRLTKVGSVISRSQNDQDPGQNVIWWVEHLQKKD